MNKELVAIADDLPVDQAMAEMKKAIELLTAGHDLTEIKTSDQRENGLDYGKRLTALSKNLEVYRKEELKPYSDKVKLINETIKPIANLIEKTRNFIKMVVNDFDVAEKKKELAAMVADEPPKIIEPVINPITQIKKRVQVTAEIVDLSLIPREYMIPDFQALNKAAKAGIDIPGMKPNRKEILSY